MKTSTRIALFLVVAIIGFTGCGTLPFLLRAWEYPERWRVRPSHKTLKVADGNTATLTLRITPPEDAIPGTYRITVGAERNDRWEESTRNSSFTYTVR